ncbi:GT2 family glycosyltransferase [Paenibacillus sp. 4624]|uniref:glycosyltransferase n=1 Tax=Paenibacillus sp. 4624 TaxID=3156453 RepID=UPI003D1B9063
MKNVVCVLGMHRSGSSLLMRALHNLGIDLGEEEKYVSYGEDNPEGFWEHKEIVGIHEKILAVLNRGWDSLLPLPENWLLDPQIIEYKKELINLVKEEFGTSTLWGWKDPRTCLFLPLWKEIFDILDLNVKYVISSRNPLDIAVSLNKRNNISKEYGVALWYHYMINVLHYTKGSERILVNYDALIENPHIQIEQIVEFCDLKLSDEAVEQVRNSIKIELRHSLSSYKELTLYAPRFVMDLYVNLEKLILDTDEEYSQRYLTYQSYNKLLQTEVLQDQISAANHSNEKLQHQYDALATELKSVNQKYVQQLEYVNVNNELRELEQELNDSKTENIQLRTEATDNKREAEDANIQLDLLNRELCLKNQSMEKAVALSIELSKTKMFKLVHFMYRVKHQLIRGGYKEKKEFFAWLLKRRNKRLYISDHRFNPLYQVIDTINLNSYDSLPIRQNQLESKPPADSKESVHAFKARFDYNRIYNKMDVIILSIIDHSFRYQRPQHLSKIFSSQGHRVFYINANFTNVENKIEEISENEWIVSLRSDKQHIYSVGNEEMSFITTQLEKIIEEYGIRDCFVTVQYPTWYSSANSLKEKFGFSMVTDYLDDFTGFQETANSYLSETSTKLLKNSDLIVASSNYLANKALYYSEQISIVRNGTEYSRFNKAYRPERKPKKNKIVGYYGAVSHWFDFGKVEFLATHLPEVEFVIIGDITDGKERLTNFSNIKLLGEKKYQELPGYLETFDVCLIPFDTSTDLIQATNPVKFYEYLSAGKKIVATELPELMPYRNKFVYLTNENDLFLDYVNRCLEGNDELAPASECLQFAESNDWKNRGIDFLDAVHSSLPLVSIIVLTYNQLEYTKKCIDSIINKTAYSRYEIIIVDNMSTDGTKEYLIELEKNVEQVTIILNDTNYGFAGGNNIGLKKAKGDFFILLNNDTVVTRGWLTGLIKHFNDDPQLGLLGPVTNSIGNEAMIKTSYDTINDMEQFAYQYTSEHKGELNTRIRALAMYCVVIPRRVFETIGFLDENYRIGMFEDDDYSMAALQSGYSLACAEDVFIHHFGSVSFKKLEDKKYKEIFDSNKSYFEKKWNATWLPHKYRDGI